ncbi:DUF7948 domain-containing protein [Hymenobacter terrestris]|uniref:Gliding motility-associated C-terminal domain-containing protein n=1 Tax=Hymenobacter terrestris TaxID=2748310 RepID=A0ABX2Q5W4_9BACT|nr:gliding motility-associated C-terminal domain-containing protein [Hymenobacter terrestris]NVO86359.1 gliding motility-associated C-terminal domain-containing protein [Hymenobacter terrestris]
MSRLLPLWLCLLLPLSLTAAPRPTAAPGPEKTLEFVENKGQWPKAVRYQAELPGGRLYLTPTGFTYSFLSAATFAQINHRHGDDNALPRSAAPAPTQAQGHAYTVSFEGGNTRATLLPEQVTSGTRNYFLGSNPREWASGVAGYRQVRYQAVYPGIDVRVYENAGQNLEYDFEVAPGAKPDNIRLRYAGPDAVRLSAEGQLLIETSVGTVVEQAPLAWQTTAAGRRMPVSCRFELQGSTVRFRLGAYDAKLPLIIDPTVLFSSFTGSLADNWGFTATHDAQGNMYSGGVAFGPGYPTSPGAFQTSFAGMADVAIIKYKVTASGPAARLYATYLGGSRTDAPHSLVVNGLGELVLLGSTSSGNFPVGAAAAQRTFRGGQPVNPFGGAILDPMGYPEGSDLFVTTLSADGSKLVAATYLGGTANDGLNLSLANNYGDQFRGDVLTDGANNVYIASTTNSPDFPVAGALQRNLRGATDAVVCQLPRLLDRLNWSTYLGGTGTDAAFSLQLSTERTLYVGGATTGTGFPTVAGSLHPQSAGGREGFVVGLVADAGTPRYGTYLGTSADDLAFFVQLDNSGDVYVLGQTNSNAYPKTAGLYGTPGARQFIHKLDATLSTTMFSTTFGSGQSQHEFSPTAFLVDDCERVYVSGWGGATNRGYSTGTTRNLPITPDAVQKTTDGNDFYVAEFAAGLTGLEYATFYGEQGGRGEHVDGGTSRFSKKGVVYQAVCGGCGGTQGFPRPPGASFYNTRNGSTNCNNAAFAINFDIITADPGATRYACATDGPVLLGGQPAGGTWSGPGVVRRPDGRYEFRPTPELVGRNVLQYTVKATGVCVSTRPMALIVAKTQPVAITPQASLCANASPITLQATPTGGTWSGPRGLSGNTFDPRLSGPGTFTLTYSISDTLACGTASTTITINAPPTPQAGPNLTLCAYETAPIQLTGATPAGGTWSGTGVTPAGLFTPPDTRLLGGIFTLTYTVSENGCAVTATRQVLLAPSPTSNAPLQVPVCERFPEFTGLAPLTLTMKPVLTGGTYEWDFGDGSPRSTEENPVHIFTQPGRYNVRLVARYANCVVETSFAPVIVNRTFVPNIITPNRDQQNQAFIPYFSCQTTQLSLYNRWGSKVYETADYRNDWQATGLADGLYYYQLKDADGRTAKGWLTVVR